MSSDTSFANGRYVEIIGRDGNGPIVECLLKGTFQYSGTLGIQFLIVKRWNNLF